MIINSAESERKGVLRTAEQMACAARTAPKTKGIDRINTLVLLDHDIEKLSKKMVEIAEEKHLDFFLRDAEVVRKSEAVVLLAVNDERSHLGDICGYCGASDCAAAKEAGTGCAFASIDLGIAIGSAVSIAADMRIDNRVLFSAGKAALLSGYFGDKYTQIIAIALSCAGKNTYFDRVEQFGQFHVDKHGQN